MPWSPFILSPIITLPSETIGIWIAACAFFAGGITNATGHLKIRDSFTRLGFPGWWCWVTAALEIATALLLLIPSSCSIGIVLGSCIMIAAIAAILRRNLYGHLPPPALFLLLLAAAGFNHPV